MLRSISLITLTFSVVQSTSFSASITPLSHIGANTNTNRNSHRFPLAFLQSLKGGALSDEEEEDEENATAAALTPPPSPPEGVIVSDMEIVPPPQEETAPPPPPPPPTPAAAAETTTQVETTPAPPAETTTQEESTPIISTTPGWLRKTFPSFPFHRLPDYLTYMRCAAIPLLCFLFYQPKLNIATGLLFALASFTDWLDGFLARRWDVSTAFGAFLDPVADKLMVSTALILLSGRHGAIVALPAAIILARELAVSALREWMAQMGQRDSVKVGYQGKVKTALTMLSLTLMLFVPEIGTDSWMGNLFLPSLASLYVSALITVTSGSVYFRAAAPALLQK